MEVLIILGALVVIAVAAFAASEFKKIAEMKGHEGGRYFWWSFLLGPIGMLMVVALPDRNKQSVTVELPKEKNQLAQAESQSDELPDL